MSSLKSGPNFDMMKSGTNERRKDRQADKPPTHATILLIREVSQVKRQHGKKKKKKRLLKMQVRAISYILSYTTLKPSQKVLQCHRKQCTQVHHKSLPKM